MGHRVSYPTEMFENTSYAIKTTEELRTAFQARIKEVNARIIDRRQRIVRIKEDHALSSERLAQLVSLYQRDSDSYMSNYNYQGQAEDEAIIPVGVIANIVSEYDMIDNEQRQVRRMELVSRNLMDEEPYYNPRTGEHGVRPCIHRLDDEELEYLGF